MAGEMEKEREGQKKEKKEEIKERREDTEAFHPFFFTSFPTTPPPLGRKSIFKFVVVNATLCRQEVHPAWELPRQRFHYVTAIPVLDLGSYFRS